MVELYTRKGQRRIIAPFPSISAFLTLACPFSKQKQHNAWADYPLASQRQR